MKLVTFIQYWDYGAQSVEIQFLSAHNLLESFDKCDANSIYEIIKTELKEFGLDISNMNGLSIDGASVMIAGM